MKNQNNLHDDLFKFCFGLPNEDGNLFPRHYQKAALLVELRHQLTPLEYFALISKSAGVFNAQTGRINLISKNGIGRALTSAYRKIKQPRRLRALRARFNLRPIRAQRHDRVDRWFRISRSLSNLLHARNKLTLGDILETRGSTWKPETLKDRTQLELYKLVFNIRELLKK